MAPDNPRRLGSYFEVKALMRLINFYSPVDRWLKIEIKSITKKRKENNLISCTSDLADWDSHPVE